MRVRASLILALFLLSAMLYTQRAAKPTLKNSHEDERASLTEKQSASHRHNQILK
jgi:uncharacterized membrane protein YgcG